MSGDDILVPERGSLHQLTVNLARRFSRLATEYVVARKIGFRVWSPGQIDERLLPHPREYSLKAGRSRWGKDIMRENMNDRGIVALELHRFATGQLHPRHARHFVIISMLPLKAAVAYGFRTGLGGYLVYQSVGGSVRQLAKYAIEEAEGWRALGSTSGAVQLRTTESGVTSACRSLGAGNAGANETRT